MEQIHDSHDNAGYSEAVAAWLEANTIRCPVGRIPREQCEALRARPLITDTLPVRRPGEYELLWRPERCKICKGWDWIKKHGDASGGAQPLPASRKEKKPMTNDKPASPAQKTKTCRKCGRTLPVTEFYECLTRRDGYRPQCKDCERAATRERSRIKKQASASPQAGATAPATDTIEPALVTLSPGVSPGAPPDARPHYDRLSKLPPRPYAGAAKVEVITKIMSLINEFLSDAYNKGLVAGRREAMEKIRAALEGGAIS